MEVALVISISSAIFAGLSLLINWRNYRASGISRTREQNEGRIRILEILNHSKELKIRSEESVSDENLADDKQVLIRIKEILLSDEKIGRVSPDVPKLEYQMRTSIESIDSLLSPDAIQVLAAYERLYFNLYILTVYLGDYTDLQGRNAVNYFERHQAFYFALWKQKSAKIDQQLLDIRNEFKKLTGVRSVQS